MSRRAHPHEIAALEARVPISDVLAAHGLDRALRQRGPYLTGPCPLHGGDNPTAFRVHLERGLWHCFTRCGGGDILDQVRVIERSSFRDALASLARIARHPTPVTSSPSPEGYAPTDFAPFSRRILLDHETQFLQRDKPTALSTAVHFEAGLAPRSPFLRDAIAVRLHDLRGHPVGCCGRRLAPRDIAPWGKWRFPRGFPKHRVLYDAHRALPHRHRSITLVECPWAVMRLHQAGVPGAVALLGTTLSPTHQTWLARAPALLLLLDGDQPGRHAATAIAARLSPHTRLATHDLPRGCDPDDLSDHELAGLVASYLPSP